MSLHALSRELLLPAGLRISIARFALLRPIQRGVRFSSSMPVVEVSFWKSLIPKPLRRSNENKQKKPKSGEWNPATFFIVIFLLIGSMSINLLSVKQDYAAFVRQSDARIGVLREVVEKLQRGEEVDVERVLGTGDPEKELEWDEVLKEVEREEAARTSRKKQAEAPPATAPASHKSSAAPTSTQADQPTKQPPAGTIRATFF